jgi:predicted NAD-dependent protein-ADP-ribosyltransferase YbiA (DUF1768 family)
MAKTVNITDTNGQQYFVFQSALSALSNSHLAPFILDGVEYNSVDQYLRKTARASKPSKEDLMRGLRAKFEQNAGAREELLASGHRTIVYADEFNRYLGSGRDIDDINNGCSRRWRGSNVLGKCLMLIRNML